MRKKIWNANDLSVPGLARLGGEGGGEESGIAAIGRDYGREGGEGGPENFTGSIRDGMIEFGAEGGGEG